MEREYTVQDYFRQMGLDGGPGSGNFGHAGRPGYTGGSAKGSGGSALRAYTTEKGYFGVKKTEHFTSATTKAKKTFSYNRWQRNLSADQKQAIADQHAHVASLTGSTESLQDYQRRLHSMLRGGEWQEKRPQNHPITVAEGYSTFKRDAATQPSEITDVLHQQGFDGPAKVVSKKEMDRMIAEDPTRPVFYRSYVAPDQQTLDAYDDCAEHGTWYVECTDGGAQYGKGMYSSGVYETAEGRRAHLSRHQRAKGAMDEMRHYIDTNKRRVTEKATPPDGIQKVADGVYATGEKRNFDDLPKQGQVVVLHAGFYSSCYAKFEHGQFTECDADGTTGSWPDTYDLDRLKRSGERAYWKEKSDWQPNPAGTVRKFMLQPDAKILKLHAIYGDKKEINAIIKKANTALHKQALKSLDKDEVTKQVSAGIDRDMTDPTDFSSAAQERVKYYTDKVEQQKKKIEEYIAAGYPEDGFTMRYAKSNLMGLQREVKQSQETYDKMNKIFSAYSTPDEFSKKITEYQKWKVLHTYLGKKVCPYKEPIFTPEQQAFLDEHADTYKTRTWENYLDYSTKASLDDNRVRDVGSAAALLGYDAIDAVDHGGSGSYTVILNRTKVIYQDEQVDVDKEVS